MEVQLFGEATRIVPPTSAVTLTLASHVSRAQRRRSGALQNRAVTNSAAGTVPAPRCTLRKSFALHRSRDTTFRDSALRLCRRPAIRSPSKPSQLGLLAVRARNHLAAAPYGRLSRGSAHARPDEDLDG